MLIKREGSWCKSNPTIRKSRPVKSQWPPPRSQSLNSAKILKPLSLYIPSYLVNQQCQKLEEQNWPSPHQITNQNQHFDSNAKWPQTKDTRGTPTP